ncbi:hypothetical protein CAPTEDRAFT_204610 [Capitella teleta]|uniref:Meiotic nuclear division protein 1 homolog n=1 Tax=Capitella teleta TaxID=283909 RepID=R7ULB4_CAPTE|nr:hypothetical protein CAPTEDRAFT_204610 [Capitella teleta]|eukprot:ELU07005.1 hypothetical protein CAPTEDRAFT_204610 [Capitella teleta]
MSVKEILTSLVDDAMVDTEKIGTSVYFWAFPSKASQSRKRKIGELENTLVETGKKRKLLEENVLQAKVGREDTDNREEILMQLAKKEAELHELKSELEKYRECDPEVMQQMKEDVVVAKEAVNRWTDNVFSVKSWIKNKFSFDDSTIDKQFGIPEDFDYID